MKKQRIIIGVIILVLITTLGIVIGIQYKKKMYQEYYNNLSQEEKEKIVIDEYNFEQLEKVRSVLDKLDKNSYEFYGIDMFNKRFNQDITTIKNCYFLASRNEFFKDGKGGGGYIFGFKLYSNKYINKFGEENYSYPKYNLPQDIFCNGGELCNDLIKDYYIETISTPCKE